MINSAEYTNRMIEENTAKEMFNEACDRLQTVDPKKQPTQYHEAVIAWRNAEARMISLGLASR